MIPHVKSLIEVENEPTLNLLPHSSSIVYRKYKMTLMAMVWQNLGSLMRISSQCLNLKQTNLFQCDTNIKQPLNGSSCFALPREE